MEYFLLVTWYIPGIIMSLWTACVIGYTAGTLPVGFKLPVFISNHILLFIYNPVDNRFVKRPTLSECFVIALVGMLPLLSLVLLGMHVLYISLLVGYYHKEKKKERVYEEYRKVKHETQLPH